MARVIHTGDTHLGYRQYHSPERRADYLEAFARVVDDAIAMDVDAVVHAGDLFHDRRPPLADIHGAIGVLRDLAGEDIPFYAIVGNHERTRGEQWLDLFETLGLAERLGPEPVTVDGTALYGLDFVPRSKRDGLEPGFEPAGADHAALVAHGLFTPFNAEWDLAGLLEASPVGFDAVLLGDDHHPDTAEIDGVWVTYCGSTERTSAAERAERGYNIVDFDDDGVSISRRGIETRPFVFVDVELDPGEGLDRVRERLREVDLDGAVAIVDVDGDGEAVPTAEIEAFATGRGALVARVTDRRAMQETAAPEAVSFADPDEAVRERIRSLGLSEAAVAVDDAVRDVDDVAKTNVRDRVLERVEGLLDDGLAAFEPAEPDPTEAADTPAGEPAPGDDVGQDGPAESDGDARIDAGSSEARPSATGAVEAGPAVEVEPAGDEPATSEADDAEPATAGVDEERSEGDGTDGRVTTMEDFL